MTWIDFMRRFILGSGEWGQSYYRDYQDLGKDSYEEGMYLFSTFGVYIRTCIFMFPSPTIQIMQALTLPPHPPYTYHNTAGRRQDPLGISRCQLQCPTVCHTPRWVLEDGGQEDGYDKYQGPSEDYSNEGMLECICGCSYKHPSIDELNSI